MVKQKELDQKHEKKVGLFEFVNDVSTDKKYLFNDDTETGYNKFMLNRALAQHIDTILLANEMNKRPDLSNLMHHDFLFYSVDAKVRRGKWAKKETGNEELINYIKNRYTVGNERALEYIGLMSEDEITQIEKTLNAKGGRK